MELIKERSLEQRLVLAREAYNLAISLAAGVITSEELKELQIIKDKLWWTKLPQS